MKNNFSRKLRKIAESWKFGDFIRNFTAVVLGIVITFIGSDLISEYNTQKEVKTVMQLVKDELITNRNTVKSILDREIREQTAAAYLLNHRSSIDTAPEDSVHLYGSQVSQIGRYSYTNDALEMLKSSALIQNVKDKTLAFKIIKSYDAVKSSGNTFDTFINLKQMMQEKIFVGNKEINDFLATDPSVAQIWRRLIKLSEGVMMLQFIVTSHDPKDIYVDKLQLIDETIAAIEKEYN